MKKSARSLLTFAIVSLFAAGLAFAAAETVAAKAAGCCAKAKADGKACTMACCAESAKKGDNCTKCKGTGKIEKKSETKK